MGEKSGLRATVSTPSALIFSSALAGSAAAVPSVLSSAVVSALLPQATRESAITSASISAKNFFMVVYPFCIPCMGDVYLFVYMHIASICVTRRDVVAGSVVVAV